MTWARKQPGWEIPYVQTGCNTWWDDSTAVFGGCCVEQKDRQNRRSSIKNTVMGPFTLVPFNSPQTKCSRKCFKLDVHVQGFGSYPKVSQHHQLKTYEAKRLSQFFKGPAPKDFLRFLKSGDLWFRWSVILTSQISSWHIEWLMVEVRHNPPALWFLLHIFAPTVCSNPNFCWPPLTNSHLLHAQKWAIHPIFILEWDKG